MNPKAIVWIVLAIAVLLLVPLLSMMGTMGMGTMMSGRHERDDERRDDGLGRRLDAAASGPHCRSDRLARPICQSLIKAILSFRAS